MPEPQIPLTDAVIWRYMDSDKFASLLKSYNCDSSFGQLWFSFPKAFGAKHEGTFPKANESPEEFCRRIADLLKLSPQEAERRRRIFMATDTQLIRDLNFELAQLCGVSCWSQGDSLNAAMWDFLEWKNGVAVKTTVGKLEKALAYSPNAPSKNARLYSTKVGYIDYFSACIVDDKHQNLLCFVDDHYSHENEVRFIAESPHLSEIRRLMPPQQDQPFTPELLKGVRQNMLSKAREINAQNKSDGFLLPMRLNDLFASIVVKARLGRTYCNDIRSKLGDLNLDPQLVVEP